MRTISSGFGLKVHAVPYQQFYIGLFAGIYHFLSFTGIKCHGLFTDSVLTSPCHTYYLIVVEGIGSNDIYGINVRIVFDIVEILVVVAILIGNIVFGLPCFNLCGCATDYTNQFGFCEKPAWRSATPRAITAEAHDGHSTYRSLVRLTLGAGRLIEFIK